MVVHRLDDTFIQPDRQPASQPDGGLMDGQMDGSDIITATIMNTYHTYYEFYHRRNIYVFVVFV